MNRIIFKKKLIICKKKKYPPPYFVENEYEKPWFFLRSFSLFVIGTNSHTLFHYLAERTYTGTNY